jgi:hypothetical protein
VPWVCSDEEGDLVTQVKCPKSYKEYFTVIKNVKKAHEINDFGEFQVRVSFLPLAASTRIIIVKIRVAYIYFLG